MFQIADVSAEMRKDRMKEVQGCNESWEECNKNGGGVM